MTISKNFFMFLILLVSFTACGDDDAQNIIDDVIDDVSDDMMGDEDFGSITAVINGVSFANTNVESAIAAGVTKVTLNGKEAYNFSIIGAAIIPGGGRGLGVVFGAPDFSLLGAGTTLQGQFMQLGDTFSYGIFREDINGVDTVDATSVNSDNAIVSITSIDKVNLIISGTFSFTAIDENTNENYVVTQGRFIDVRYQQ